ncbi:MAG: cysteine peptidase family C39 domain-containing protein [Bacteroidota bacterium]
MTIKKIIIAVAVLSCCILIYTAFIIRQPDHYKKRAAEAISAEYLGDDGIVLQRSSNDCGPSALKMLLEDEGIIVARDELERLVPLTEHGATMLDLRSAAEREGLILTGWKLSTDTLPHISYPAILFIRKNHYIVADSVVNNFVYARDPSIGRIRIPLDRIPRVWNGEALLILAQK